MDKKNAQRFETEDERKAARQAALEARIKREQEEFEARKRRLNVDYSMFAQICKSGILADMTPIGRVEISFSPSEMLSICNGVVVEKEYLGQYYVFTPMFIDRIQKIVMLRNSTLYWQIADRI